MISKTSFDSGWSFHRGDIIEEASVSKNVTYPRAKSGFTWGLHSPTYYDANWAKVNLPHDFVINDIPDENKDNAIGFLKGETSWYRKVFTLDEKSRDKRVTIHFEGIAIHSEVYVNGYPLARNFTAYTPIDVDITDVANFGEKKNVVAIHCIIPVVSEGWWYQGGGIYRHVWLCETEKLSVDLYGVHVSPIKGEGDSWSVPVETTLRNDCAFERTARVLSEVVDGNGITVASSSAIEKIPSFGKAEVKSIMDIKSPLLWDTDSPQLYTLKTTVIENGETVDETSTVFGFREIRFDAEKGFFLNGRNVKIKGVCCHQDFGLTGIVMPDSVAYHRLKLLHDMGANAYRSAHNLSDEATMDSCDRLGILVFDETRYLDSSDEGIKQAETMVLRDRNHPSVIVWSVGNEEPIQNTENGFRIAQRMNAAIKKLDSTRPTTLVCCGANSIQFAEPTTFKALMPLDLVSFNYNLAFHDELHYKGYPDKAFVMGETCALQTTRGHYFADDYTKGYFSAYDHVTSRSAFNNSTRAETWAHIAEHDYIAGGFVWAGIEHRGETMWPRLCSQSGLLDLYLQKKDAYYQTMAQYTEKPMVHIVPSSWNFEGLEGKSIRVVLYTNCDETELYLNGKSLGRKKTPPHFENAEWSVPYEKGELKAVAFCGGAVVAEDTLVTSKKAHSLKLSCDMEKVKKGDTVLFTCYCVDEDGRVVPDASPLVHFTAEGGTLIGTGSDISDHTPPKCSDRRMRMGLITVAVAFSQDTEKISLIAEGNGLSTGFIEVTGEK